MARFNLIDKADAPAPRKVARSNASMAEFDQFVLSTYGSNQVGEIAPEADDKPRSTRLKVAQAIKRLVDAGQVEDGSLKVWSDEAGVVYVERKQA